MSDDTPKDAAVASMCDKLQKARQGLAALGIQAHILTHASDKLAAQADEIARLKADPAYVTGYSDGHRAAFATGIPCSEDQGEG